MGVTAQELDMRVRGLKPISFYRFWPLGVAARIAYGRLPTALQS